MTQATFTQPNQRVRLGNKKYLELKRGQDFIEGLAWFSVIAVTAMFLIDGGLKSLSDPSSILSAIDRLTALVATDLLLIDILLIARIPWIDHYFGHDRATTAHKKLQWLLATTVSPDMGTPKHVWIAPKKKESGATAKRKALQEIYPTYKDDEIDVMMQMVSQKEIDAYFKSAGQDRK